MEAVFLGTFISSVKCIGLTMHGFMASYFYNKPFVGYSAFDVVIFDDIVSFSLFSVVLYVIFMIAFLGLELSVTIIHVFTILSISLWHLFCTSVSVTFLLKYCYLRFGAYVFEYEDSTVRLISLCTKGLLTIIFLLLDNFGPLQNETLPHGYLDYEGKYPGQSILKDGIGLPVNMTIMVILVFVVQMQATKMNEDTHESFHLPHIRALLLIGFLGIYTIITFLLNNFSDVSTHTLVVCFQAVLMISMDVMMPFVAILWHDGLKRYFLGKLSVPTALISSTE